MTCSLWRLKLHPRPLVQAARHIGRAFHHFRLHVQSSHLLSSPDLYPPRSGHEFGNSPATIKLFQTIEPDYRNTLRLHFTFSIHFQPHPKCCICSLLRETSSTQVVLLLFGMRFWNVVCWGPAALDRPFFN